MDSSNQINRTSLPFVPMRGGAPEGSPATREATPAMKGDSVEVGTSQARLPEAPVAFQPAVSEEIAKPIAETASSAAATGMTAEGVIGSGVGLSGTHPALGLGVLAQLDETSAIGRPHASQPTLTGSLIGPANMPTDVNSWYLGL